MRIIGALLILLFCGIVSWIIYNQVNENHLQRDDMLDRLRASCLDLHPIFKDIKLYKGNKSYTINKEKVYLCLKDENGEYYPESFLRFVLIHEIAHVLNKKDVGHTDEFNRIFDELLEKAELIGIYDSNMPKIQNYCPGKK
jgi:hypothetical protein